MSVYAELILLCGLTPPHVTYRYGTEYFALDKVNGQLYVVSLDDKWKKIPAIAQKVSSYSLTPMRTSGQISQQTLPSLSGFKKTPNAESTRLPQQSSVLADTAPLDDQQMVAYFVEQTTKRIMQEILGKAQEEVDDLEQIEERLLAEQERQRVNEEKLQLQLEAEAIAEQQKELSKQQEVERQKQLEKE